MQNIMNSELWLSVQLFKILGVSMWILRMECRQLPWTIMTFLLPTNGMVPMGHLCDTIGWLSQEYPFPIQVTPNMLCMHQGLIPTA